MSKTPEQIAEMRHQIVPKALAYAASEGLSHRGTIQAAVRLGIEAGIRAEQQEPREPGFDHEDYPDKYRDLWNENMPRMSGRMYFAIPGEQPIHLSDDEAKHILAYLSEKNR